MAGPDTTPPQQLGPFRIAPVLWLSLGFIFLVSRPNLIDPMIRHDDFPALLGYGDLFWHKTLHEGRWINYLWHLREIMTPAWLNFALYQVCWAIIAACIAIAAVPARKPTIFIALLATMILLAPSATLISLWFNTLQLGLAIVALYAVIVCRCSERTARWLLPVFTLPALMAYTTYPLMLLALCLIRSRRRSLRDLFGLLTLFGGSFILAIGITYTLNWYVHGVFGVPLADWREATPAQSLGDLWTNLPVVQTTFAFYFEQSSFGSRTLLFAHATCLGLATFVMARRAPMEALYLYAGLLTGSALVALQSMKLGVQVPVRAMTFFWVFYAIIFVRGVQLLTPQTTLAARVGLSALIILVLSYAGQAHKVYTHFHDWQAQTRHTAQDLVGYSSPVYVFGRAMYSEAGRRAAIQSEWALFFRIEQLSGHRLIMCDSNAADCDGVNRDAARAQATTGWHLGRIDGNTVLVVEETADPEG